MDFHLNAGDGTYDSIRAETRRMIFSGEGDYPAPDPTVLSWAELERVLNSQGVYRVPDTWYQLMGATLPRNTSREEKERAQENIKQLLFNWLEQVHPGRVLNSFDDYNSSQARALHPSLMWGMYVKLVDDRGALDDVFKQIGRSK